MLECSHNMAAHAPQSKQYKRAKDIQEQSRSFNSFLYNVIFYYTLLVTQVSPRFSVGGVWIPLCKGVNTSRWRISRPSWRLAITAVKWLNHMNSKIISIHLRVDPDASFPAYTTSKSENIYSLAFPSLESSETSIQYHRSICEQLAYFLLATYF